MLSVSKETIEKVVTESLSCPWCFGRVVLGGYVTHLEKCEPYQLVVNPAPPDVLILPVDSAARKGVPLVSGLLDYFPAALAEIAQVSKAGNDKHNPGADLHWSREKSNDHADCLMRHLLERGTLDAEDGLRHSAKLAWRALALLQLELEAAGAPEARGAR